MAFGELQEASLLIDRCPDCVKERTRGADP